MIEKRLGRRKGMAVAGSRSGIRKEMFLVHKSLAWQGARGIGRGIGRGISRDGGGGWIKIRRRSRGEFIEDTVVGRETVLDPRRVCQA